jgi:hypothetical protein
MLLAGIVHDFPGTSILNHIMLLPVAGTDVPFFQGVAR